LRAGRSQNLLKVETRLNKDPDLIKLIARHRIIKVKMQDFTLNLTRVLALKKISVMLHEEQTATKGPNIDLVCKTRVLKDQFRG
jgi:hypothetical protein